MNFYLEKMIELGVDGVDFHAFTERPPHCTIIQSNTKKEFENGNIITPRSGYTFWINDNGHKKYICSENKYKLTSLLTKNYKFGDKLIYSSPSKPNLHTPCIFIRDDCGKAVIIFQNAEWVARASYHLLSKE